MRQAIYSLIDFIQEARNAELEIANQYSGWRQVRPEARPPMRSPHCR
jgi:hypothetical protein